MQAARNKLKIEPIIKMIAGIPSASGATGGAGSDLSLESTRPALKEGTVDATNTQTGKTNKVDVQTSIPGSGPVTQVPLKKK
mmetsp:Transcript_25524/g.55493  ORF Transcript_25524/g.55493 Transcript_25524/m.55493 type:complete len:82 (-) Transcript_25524:153-398(-)